MTKILLILFFALLFLLFFYSKSNRRLAQKTTIIPTYAPFLKEQEFNPDISTDNWDLHKLRLVKFKRSQYKGLTFFVSCLLYTSPSPRDMRRSRMPSSA